MPLPKKAATSSRPKKKDVKKFVRALEDIEKAPQDAEKRAAFRKSVLEISATLLGSALLAVYIKQSPTFKKILKAVMSNSLFLKLARKIPGLVPQNSPIMPPPSTGSRMEKIKTIVKYAVALSAWGYTRRFGIGPIPLFDIVSSDPQLSNTNSVRRVGIPYMAPGYYGDAVALALILKEIIDKRKK